MTSPSLPSIGWLQSFYATAQVTATTPATEVEQKAVALKVPDPALAASVAKFLPAQPSTGTTFSEQDVSDAFSKLVATDTKSTHWRGIIRGAEQPMARFFADLDLVVGATDMGRAPSEQDLRDELAALYHSAA